MRSLTLKLTIAFLAVSLAGTLLLALWAGRTTRSAFTSYVHEQEQAEVLNRLADYYRLNGGWEGVEELFGSAPATGQGARPGRGQGTGIALADPMGRVIIPGAGNPRGSQLTGEALAGGVPVVVAGETVGFLLGRRGTAAEDEIAGRFLDQMNRALLLAAGGATAAALVLAILLARTLTRPLRELTRASRALARGELGRQVAVSSGDELGELALAFNQMSAELAGAAERRRRLTADIAHDLRTPLAIIQGHAEALRDGVLPPGAETFTLIHDEAQRLGRLVEDLRTLSRAEAGELPLNSREVDAKELLAHLAAAYAPQAQARRIRLSTSAGPDLVAVRADPDRLAQVLGNLVDNALRHTPPGGEVTLTATRHGEELWLQIADNGPGIAPGDLPHIFERFYRGDRARSRQSGGSGLGLAIAHSLTAAHGGRLWAESEPGQGATFTVALPNAL
ncbi:MAG: HAMP domain-containing sensor histidine kinase [Anaerolineae bacterium]|nr:HAMP domain-containing sensor histidine kinase [Anaerolineae bacterium]